MREGNDLIGWGMASSVYPVHRSAAAAARARIHRDGSILVESGTQDLGTGTYTVMTQVAADAMGVPVAQVTFRLGDTQGAEAPRCRRIANGDQRRVGRQCGGERPAAETGRTRRFRRRLTAAWRGCPGTSH